MGSCCSNKLIFHWNQRSARFRVLFLRGSVSNPPASLPVLPQPQLTHAVSSPGVTEANCTAQSRPPAEITWEVGDENRTLGVPVSSAYEHGDGTTTVTSTLLFQSGLLGDMAVKCVVRHPGLEKPLMLMLDSDGETAKQYYILVQVIVGPVNPAAEQLHCFTCVVQTCSFTSRFHS